jgi:hypothetical protein
MLTPKPRGRETPRRPRGRALKAAGYLTTDVGRVPRGVEKTTPGRRKRRETKRIGGTEAPGRGASWRGRDNPAQGRPADAGRRVRDPGDVTGRSRGTTSLSADGLERARTLERVRKKSESWRRR